MGAAYALAEIGPDAGAGAPALREALNDPDEQVRQAATYALGRIPATP
jgi:HEAT repeat protein